ARGHDGNLECVRSLAVADARQRVVRRLPQLPPRGRGARKDSPTRDTAAAERRLTMTLNPQIALSFNGTCEAAFRCYERCLNGTITFMVTWGNSPSAAEAPADWVDKIYHATLKV